MVTTKPGAACAFYYAFVVPLARPQAFEWLWCVASGVLPRPVRRRLLDVSIYTSVCVGPASCFNGDRLLGELTQVSSLRTSDTLSLLNIPRSKRWIIDRASLKQARSEDLQYVDSPEHIDFLDIYFANRAVFLFSPIESFPVSAHA
jgi:hypothetical protein